jgi:acyl carrier protein
MSISIDTAIERTVRDYIVENFLFGAEETTLADTDSLIEGGIVDSAAVLSLVIFLEGTFDIQVADNEVVPENLDSIRKLADYVRRKRGTSAA